MPLARGLSLSERDIDNYSSRRRGREREYHSPREHDDNCFGTRERPTAVSVNCSLLWHSALRRRRECNSGGRGGIVCIFWGANVYRKGDESISGQLPNVSELQMRSLSGTPTAYSSRKTSILSIVYSYSIQLLMYICVCKKKRMFLLATPLLRLKFFSCVFFSAVNSPSFAFLWLREKKNPHSTTTLFSLWARKGK